MSKVKGCKARRYSDEWHCNTCGLVWSVDDQDPPQCKTGRQQWLDAVKNLKSRNVKK